MGGQPPKERTWCAAPGCSKSAPASSSHQDAVRRLLVGHHSGIDGYVWPVPVKSGMRKMYRVKLFGEERGYLEELLRAGKAAARTLMHARILLKADEGLGVPAWSDDQIVDALDVSRSTVERVRTLCVEEGPEAALRPRPSPTPPLRKLDGAQEARLIAVACSPPPEGRKRWTLRLLADKVVELEIVDAVSYETVRRTLKKTISSRG